MGLSPKRNLIPNRIMRGAVTRGLLAARNHRGKVRVKTNKLDADKVEVDKTYKSDVSAGRILLKLLIIIIAIIIIGSINYSKYNYIPL